MGGRTSAEGNLILGGDIGMRITNPGIRDCCFAGNTVSGKMPTFPDASGNTSAFSKTYTAKKSGKKP
ncbi:MAG: hypothetical protein GX592_12915 [Clostridiales bacterium]|nr:hypothetical protein [Clostridiales bacterium]